MPENNSLDEQGQHGPTSLHISEGNTQDDRQRRPFPLGVPLTGNILFTIIWIVGLGIPKAVYSYRGQSLISPTLDWVAGIIFTLISFWLGVIESKRPELCPQFFEVDLAPCVLKFLRRDDVLVWLTSVLPLLLVVESKSSSVVYPDRERSFKWVWDEMLGFGRNFTTVRVEKVGPTWVVITTTFEDSYNLGDPNKPHSRSTKITQLYENGYILHALGAFMAVFLFCIHGSRVLWPRPFQGKLPA
ncbi:hypothetical protein DFH94DRAFT_150887 [Russula ochroleuca]|uniref:Transmembrane protein n=1 Tax=Russula ochroleuca TaxID=152965 RepID=A0A9P5MQG3_9AGAM|nr:hypothetical protein DFH94DRAFT_150887 [Russula ochroleuca]